MGDEEVVPDKPVKLSAIERAEQLVKDLERLETIKNEFEEAVSRSIMAGKSDAGEPAEKPKVEETPKEYAEKVLRNESEESKP